MTKVMVGLFSDFQMLRDADKSVDAGQDNGGDYGGGDDGGGGDF